MGHRRPVREAAPLPPSWSQDVSFCTTLLGTGITRFHGVLGLQDVGVSPELGQQLPQYVTEEVLREVALGWHRSSCAWDRA